MRFESRWPRVFTGAVLLAVVCSGCLTSLGYVQENIKDREIADRKNLVPSYDEVKIWARRVQDAYDARATANRHAQSFGALLATAAAGTLIGLAAFDRTSPAIAGIPLGTGFLSGAASIYNNDLRAQMYSKASLLIKDVINLSDERLRLWAPATTEGIRSARILDEEASCLKRHVDEVMGKVQNHINLSVPENVVKALSSITSQSTQDSVNKIVAVAKGDLKDLDQDPSHLRASYCAESGRVLAADDVLGIEPRHADGHLTRGSDLVSAVTRLRGDLRTATSAAPDAGKLEDLAKALFADAAKAEQLKTANEKIATLKARKTAADEATRGWGMENDPVQQMIAAWATLRAARDGASKDESPTNLAAVTSGIAALQVQHRVLEGYSAGLETKKSDLVKASTEAQNAVKTGL
jgi:hypothetical protein